MVYVEIDPKDDEHVVKKITNLFLYFVAVVVNISCFTCGIAFAWSSPVTPKLKDSPDNPLGYSLSEDEISWLASLLSLGAAVGPYIGGYLADKIGRKRTFLAAMLPMILSFLFMAFGKNLYLFYVARFIMGTCVGLFLTVVPMYLGEIAEVHNRGILGCFTLFFLTIGSLYCFCLGPYISLQWFNVCNIVGPVIFFVVVMFFIPESPCYLVLKGRLGEARQVLSKIRFGDVEGELGDISTTVKESLASQGGISDIWNNKHLSNALIVSVGLMIIQQLTAISVITFYMQIIFEGAGSGLSSEVSVIIVGAVQVLGTFASTVSVDKSGRKPLLLISTTIVSVTLTILSIYFYLLTTIDVSSINWLPIVTLMVYIFFYNIGIGPLCFTVMGEIFPPQVKSAASSISVSCCYMSSFAATKLFPLIVSVMGNWFGFLIFAIGNTLGCIFIWRRVPETKGRTLAEILEYFK